MPLLRVRTQIGGSTQGPAVSNLFFAGSGSSDALAAHGAVADFWGDMLGLMVNYTTLLVEGEIAELDTASGQVIDVHSTDPVAHTGASASAALPPMTQGLLRFRTGVFRDGREVRGRIFIPGPTEEGNDIAKPTSSYRTTLASAGANLGSSQVVYSRPTSPEAGDGGFELVSGRSVWEKWAVLRSRRD